VKVLEVPDRVVVVDVAVINLELLDN